MAADVRRPVTPGIPPAVTPDQAAQSLSEVRDRQRRALAAGLIPTWYWWAIALLVTMFCAGVESESPAVGVAATIVFGLGIATSVFIVATRTKAQLRNTLLGVAGTLAIAGFTLATVAVTFGVSMLLQAADVPYPATFASLVNAAALIIGGPVLMRKLHAMAVARTLG
jgi:hypothetical protein